MIKIDISISHIHQCNFNIFDIKIITKIQFHFIKEKFFIYFQLKIISALGPIPILPGFKKEGIDI